MFISHGRQERLGYMMKTALVRLMSGSLRDMYKSNESIIVFFITTKKSKIIYELLSEHIDWFVKINIKILINPKKLLINPKIFYSFFLLVTL